MVSRQGGKLLGNRHFLSVRRIYVGIHSRQHPRRMPCSRSFHHRHSRLATMRHSQVDFPHQFCHAKVAAAAVVDCRIVEVIPLIELFSWLLLFDFDFFMAFTSFQVWHEHDEQRQALLLHGTTQHCILSIICILIIR